MLNTENIHQKIIAILKRRILTGWISSNSAKCNGQKGGEKKYYKKLYLLGNLDIDFPLAKGTTEDVRVGVKELIHSVGPGGGFLHAYPISTGSLGSAGFGAHAPS